MVRIRIGNDIPIRWAVTRCGVPEDFAGKSLKLYMRTAYSETEVTDFAVNGNVISWTFPGAQQKATGTYTFTLVENEGLDDMATVDACDALKLVACTCSAECAESVEVTSDIDVPANGRTPVFATGETETLDPGSPATSEVVPSGRNEDGNPVYRLDFGVPEGQPGKTPVFSAGQAVTGEPGTQASAKVTEDGADEQGNPKYKIVLTIPRGDTGKTPVINTVVTVTTLEPGSDATASITPDGAYSCRDGRGNLAAVFRLRDGLLRASRGYTRPCWAARYDLRAFFMSIDRRRLYEDFVRLIEDGYDGDDRDTLLYLTRIITLTCPADRAVRRCPRWEWDSVERGKSVWDLPWHRGLAIGNLPSQLGANVENAPHLRLLEEVGMPATNYVDDFAHAVTDREAFLAMMSYTRGWLKEERGLTLHPRKFYLQPADRGVKYLGCVVKGDRIYIGNRVVHSLFTKVRWHNGVLGTSAALRRRHAERFANLLNSYLGLMRHFRTYNIRRRAAEEVLSVWADCVSFSPDCTRAVAAPRCRRLDRARFRAGKEHREDLLFIRTNML